MDTIYTVAIWLYMLCAAFTVASIFGRISRTSKATRLDVWVQYYAEAAALIIGGAVVLVAPWNLSVRLVVALALLALSMAINMVLSAPRWRDGAPPGTTAPAPLDEVSTQPMERA